MAQLRRPSRRRGGRTDSGAAWISYSDMMAALLLVFVLVLCYSMYQYFAMLQMKSAELEEKGTLLAAQEAQLSTQQSQLDAQRTTLENQQAELTAKQNELTGALSTLDEQNLTLEEQRGIIAAAQTALGQKEDDLVTAQAALALKQGELDKATTLVTSQQAALDTQQRKLDDLVGVRTQIIQDLGASLSKADLKATVDKNTGDIMLESAVFFDVGKDAIKADGQELLNRFIPVYLGVLLSPEYSEYLGEIVIEGHTDTQGDYLMNLQLSQERALSVATFCLQMKGLNAGQQEQLRSILTAKGRSYSDPIYDAEGNIDMDASRRVAFKFRLKDAEMIDEMRAILAE